MLQRVPASIGLAIIPSPDAEQHGLDEVCFARKHFQSLILEFCFVERLENLPHMLYVGLRMLRNYRNFTQVFAIFSQPLKYCSRRL